MLTEEELPMYLSSIDCDKGCAIAVYKTVIKRNGVEIHAEYEYKEVDVTDMQESLEQVRVNVDKKAKGANGEL